MQYMTLEKNKGVLCDGGSRLQHDTTALPIGVEPTTRRRALTLKALDFATLTCEHSSHGMRRTPRPV